MSKDAYINARVDKRTKAKAQKVLRQVGLTITDAITLFLHQIILHEGLPFDVRVPNEETRAALRDLDAGGGTVYTGATKDILREIVEAND